MAEEPLPPPEEVSDEDGGGPVKPFLEHLEDLRWTLIKAVSAVLISMIICLVAGNKIVEILTYPLRKAQSLSDSVQHNAPLRLGSTIIGKIPISTVSSNLWGSSVPDAFEVAPILVGTNVVLAIVADTNAVASGGSGMVSLKNYGPLGGFAVALDMALYGGFALSAPFVMFFLGQFILPALKVREKYFLYRALGVGVGLFFAGVVFCYFIIMQVTLLATVQFSQWLGFSADEWRAEDYIDFVMKMLLAVGVSFQLPVVLLTLVKIGLINYQTLSKQRSYFVVINLVACAFITPSGDPVTMLVLAIPVQILYEASVFVAWTWWRKEQKELAALEAGDGSTT